MRNLSQWARGIAVFAVFVMALVTIAPQSADAKVRESRKYGLWEYQYFRGDIEWCGVKTNWPNNKMVLTIRLRPNTLDYFFYNRDWNLTRNRRMGDTVFIFGRRDFYADTETLNSNQALFGTFRTQIGPFLRRFKSANRLKLEFPTDQSIGVNLKGSRKAMEAAERCWNRRFN